MLCFVLNLHVVFCRNSHIVFRVLLNRSFLNLYVVFFPNKERSFEPCMFWDPHRVFPAAVDVEVGY